MDGSRKMPLPAADAVDESRPRDACGGGHGGRRRAGPQSGTGGNDRRSGACQWQSGGNTIIEAGASVGDALMTVVLPGSSLGGGSMKGVLVAASGRGVTARSWNGLPHEEPVERRSFWSGPYWQGLERWPVRPLRAACRAGWRSFRSDDAFRPSSRHTLAAGCHHDRLFCPPPS